MRIISGKYKGRRISVPANLKARPTTDFARESLFNVLNNIICWEETTALDLFAGTGSISLELSSRGCPDVFCIESAPRHHEFIKKNVEILGAKEVHPIKADAFRFLESTNNKYDLIFADPPYDLKDLERIPELVISRNLLKPGGYFIFEHSSKHNFKHIPVFVEERKYGSVHFSFFKNDEDLDQINL